MARLVLMDRNNTIKELCEITGLADSTLRNLRRRPEKLETTAWITVHRLAQYKSNNPYLKELYN
ncbi:hypothetical protein AB9M75_06130 [Lactobacillus sp. AN1001]